MLRFSVPIVNLFRRRYIDFSYFTEGYLVWFHRRLNLCFLADVKIKTFLALLSSDIHALLILGGR